MTLAVRGMKELTRTFSHAPADVKKAYRAELKTVALPVKETAQKLAVARIRNMRSSPAWARMRVGVTTRVVYVAPAKRGARGQSLRRRPNLYDLLQDRVLDPALRVNEGRVVHDFDQMLDRLVHKWGTDGP